MENTINKYIIYKAENVKTGEIYIGATTQSIESRKNDHIQKSKSGSNNKFHIAINKYGSDSFNWVQIDTATTPDELASKEIKYISENNSFENGYNSDKGGGIKKSIYQYNLDGKLINTFKDLKSAAQIINVKKQYLSRACWNNNHTLRGYLWSYEYKEPFLTITDKRKKQVIQYNLNGEEITRFKSVTDASKETGISNTGIAKCCRGERKTSGGFIWNYI
ncbi:NUMOD1 domain-containing DNA-binding protein [Flavobacterium nitratireducens]|uniref:NUMOD1 domain-containing DNA-binding protein n=1 Tax=Flavobacterium nitratireducens TaxID=992289 RepID=UPI0024154CD1|nr:NUMOD1 domain-containing DNA-binding protein [Flavobacterium nitratireducens]